MEYLFIPQVGDDDIISHHIQTVSALSHEDLVVRYIKNIELGIIGSRAQALMLYAMGKVFLKSFGESPVYLKDRVLLGLRGRVIAINEKLIFPDEMCKN